MRAAANLGLASPILAASSLVRAQPGSAKATFDLVRPELLGGNLVQQGAMEKVLRAPPFFMLQLGGLPWSISMSSARQGSASAASASQSNGADNRGLVVARQSPGAAGIAAWVPVDGPRLAAAPGPPVAADKVRVYLTSVLQARSAYLVYS